MNTIVTSKEEILKTSREMIRQQGWSTISIRSVAAACGVSVGSIYNYFDSKSDLVGATVESVWCEIFHHPDNDAVFRDVQVCVTWIYERMAYGGEQYPGFFTLHSLGFMGKEKSDGKRRMQKTWHHILSGLCDVLRQDEKIRPDAFTDQFTPEKFADVLFSLDASPPCFGRTMIPQRCWRSSAERFIESSALCGHFLSRKLNIGSQRRFPCEGQTQYAAVRHELRQGGIRRPPEIIIHTGN